MSIYPCINSGSSFSLHCLSPCLSLGLGFLLRLSLPKSLLSAFSLPSVSLYASIFFQVCFSFHPPPSQPASSLLCAVLSDLGGFISAPQPGSLFCVGLCLCISLRPPPLPPRLPGNPPHHACLRIVTQRPLPDPARRAPLFAAPPPTLPPPPHRPSGPAFPSFFPAQQSWSHLSSPRCPRKMRLRPRRRTLRRLSPGPPRHDTIVGEGRRHEGTLPPAAPPFSVPQHREAGKASSRPS